MASQNGLGDCEPDEVRRSLDLGTKLGEHHPDGLVLAVYDGAGEAILYQPKAPRSLHDLGQPTGQANAAPYPEDWTDEDIEADLEARATKNRQRAVARATAESRRYIVANRLRYMWVLTRLGGEGLHGPEGRAQVMLNVAAFVKDLRTELGYDFPYWYSPELHPAGKRESRETCPIPDECGCGGHGWHVNFFVQRSIPVAAMKRLWQAVDDGNGYEVRYKDWTRDTRLAAYPFVQKLRWGAAYGTKYASKDWSDLVLVNGAHRYEKAQGFAPQRRTFAVSDRAEAEAALAAFATTSVTYDWCSDDVEDWDGPRCWLYQFTPRGSP